MNTTQQNLLVDQWSEILNELQVYGDVGAKDIPVLASLLEFNYIQGTTHADELKKVVMKAFRDNREREQDRQLRIEIREIREAGAKRQRKIHQDAENCARIQKIAAETSDVMDRYIAKGKMVKEETLAEPSAPTKMSFLKKAAIGLASVGTVLTVVQLFYIWG